MLEHTQSVDPVNLVEASLDSQIGLLDVDQQRELADRLTNRFAWERATNLAVAETVSFKFSDDDYDLTIEALKDLGINRNLVAKYESLNESLNSDTLSYLGRQLVQGYNPELTFYLPFRKELGLKKLLAKFDTKGTKRQRPSYIWEDLWESYETYQHKFGTDIDTEPIAAFALNNSTSPISPTDPANRYSEAGLVYTDKNVVEQQEYLRKEQTAAKQLGVDLESMTVSQYIVLQAKRRQAGLPLLDRSTFTCFIQYPNRIINDVSCVPGARVSSGDDRLRLGGAAVDHARERTGIRRVVRISKFR